MGMLTFWQRGAMSGYSTQTVLYGMPLKLRQYLEEITLE